ncbi:MAG: glycosyltransferase [Pseudomonadota bacterium]
MMQQPHPFVLDGQAVGETSQNASLVAVVVSHNRLSKIKRTVQRLLSCPPDQLQALVIVDNASTDGTPEWLSGLKSERITLVKNDQNLGGAGGFEQGMRQAVQAYDPDWLVLMDDDARPTPTTMAAFHSEDRSRADAWAAAVYHPEGAICDMNRPSRNPFWHPGIMRRTVLGGGRNGFHIGEAEYNAGTSCEIDGTSFVGFFISRRGIEKAGYPDGSMFIYGDDVLYSLGLRARGGKILFDPSLEFEHDFTTINEAGNRFQPLWKSYYHYRNLLMVYRLCSGPWFLLVGPAAAGKWLLKLRHYKGQRLSFLRLVLRALRDGFLFRTTVDHTRVLRWANEE